MKFKFGKIAPILTTLLLLPAIVSADIQYTVTDLGALPGETASQPTAINDLGQVVGYSTGSQTGTAWLYSNGTLTSLGTLGAPGSQAAALNNQGQVVGQSTTPAYDGGHGFLYSNGAMQDIGRGLAPSGINDSGIVTGNYFANAEYRAFIYSNGLFQDLGSFVSGGSAQAFAINNKGQITGGSGVGGATHAFLYSNGAMQDLGTLGGTSSGGYAINDLGHVAGTSLASTGDSHAFLYDGITMTDVGALAGGFSSFGYGINDSDQLVGEMATSSGNRAFLYNGGALYNLNDLIDPSLGVLLGKAVGINDAGQIIAWGDLGQLGYPTNTQAFLLTPTTPEPGMGVIAVVAALALLRRTRSFFGHLPRI